MGVAALALALALAPRDDWNRLCSRIASDVDGDGTPDVAVTAGGWSAECSWAHVFSGRGGWPLAAIPAGPGVAAAALGPDRDGDGRGEALVGRAAGARDRWAAGPYELRFGLEDEAGWIGLGWPDCRNPVWALAAGGDADGDGTPDVLVTRIHCGVEVFSGRTGAPLHSIAFGRYRPVEAGSSADWVGDVDHDGCDDFAVAANEVPWGDPPRADKGFAYVYSGRTGAILRSYEPWKKRMDVCRAGDADGDGTPDVAVFVEEDRAVRVLSGVDLAVIWEVGLDALGPDELGSSRARARAASAGSFVQGSAGALEMGG